MLMLILAVNALVSIAWVLNRMRHSADLVLPLTAMAWLLLYLWMPHILLVTAAVATPITIGYRWNRRRVPSPAIAHAAYDGSAFVVPEPVSREMLPASCLGYA